MKKLISLLLSFVLIFNVIGYNVFADEINQQNGGQATAFNGVSEIEKVDKKFWSLLGNLLAVTGENIVWLCSEVGKSLLTVPARIFLASDELFTGKLSSEISLCRNDENCKKELDRVIEEKKKIDMCLNDKNCKKEFDRVLKGSETKIQENAKMIAMCIRDEICKKEFDKFTKR